MPDVTPTPDGQIMTAFMEAQRLSLLALVRCLEDNGALKPGQYADALRLSMENSQDEVDVMTLALMHRLRRAILE